jgi:hypothetical protein
MPDREGMGECHPGVDIVTKKTDWLIPSTPQGEK